jgi:hypothetical protein
MRYILIEYLNGFIVDRRINSSLYSTAHLGFLFPVCIQIYYFVISYVKPSKFQQFQYVDYIKKFVMVCFCLIPLYMINVNFYRYLRTLAIPMLILSEIRDSSYAIGSRKRFVFSMINFAGMMIWVLFEAIWGDIYRIVVPFFVR